MKEGGRFQAAVNCYWNFVNVLSSNCQHKYDYLEVTELKTELTEVY